VMEIVENFPAEIEHIWMREWSFITVLYIVQRYLPIFDSVVVLFRNDFAPNLSVGQCTSGYRFITWSSGVGIMLSEIILALRVWTVWKRGTQVTIGLLVLFFGCWVPAFVFLGKFLGSLKFVPAPGRGCSIIGETTILYVFWLMMMVYEAGESFHPFPPEARYLRVRYRQLDYVAHLWSPSVFVKALFERYFESFKSF
ncbi:hypothetical protein L218DRAFT_887996, partial [Marasmius fiardii PR-910]